MSIRPVDHQVTVSKSGEISRMHFQEQQKNLINQQSQNNTLQSDAAARLKQVKTREDIYKVKMQEREKQEKHQEKHREEKKEEQREYTVHNRKDENARIIGSSIDIRL